MRNALKALDLPHQFRRAPKVYAASRIKKRRRLTVVTELVVKICSELGIAIPAELQPETDNHSEGKSNVA